MAKHNQTIRRIYAGELSVFDNFVGLLLRGQKTQKGSRAKLGDDPLEKIATRD